MAHCGLQDGTVFDAPVRQRKWPGESQAKFDFTRNQVVHLG